MTEQVQLHQKFQEMKLRADEYKSTLKKVYNDMNAMSSVNDYGLTEDPNFVVPVKVSSQTVEQYEVKKQRETSDIHNDMQKVQKLLLKINRTIHNVQRTSFKHRTCKRRHREYQLALKKQKEDRKKRIEESRKNNINVNTVSTISINDLYDNDDNIDEFDVPNLC